MVEPEKPQVTILHLHFAHWITKATGTHSEYVILTAFAWQQFCERALLLRCVYTVLSGFGFMFVLMRQYFHNIPCHLIITIFCFQMFQFKDIQTHNILQSNLVKLHYCYCYFSLSK